MVGKVVKSLGYRGFQIVVVERREDFAVSFARDGGEFDPPLLGWFESPGEALAGARTLVDLTVEMEQRASALVN